MSDLTVVRNAIGAKLSNLGLIVHNRWEGDVVPPAAIIVPPSAGPLVRYVTSQGGQATHDAFYSIQLLFSKSVDSVAQEELDKYISPSGSKSIYLAVTGNVTDTHWAEVIEARNYGTVRIGSGFQEIVREYLGVEFLVSVGLYD